MMKDKTVENEEGVLIQIKCKTKDILDYLEDIETQDLLVESPIILAAVQPNVNYPSLFSDDRNLNEFHKTGIKGVYNRWVTNYSKETSKLINDDNATIDLVVDKPVQWSAISEPEITTAIELKNGTIISTVEFSVVDFKCIHDSEGCIYLKGEPVRDGNSLKSTAREPTEQERQTAEELQNSHGYWIYIDMKINNYKTYHLAVDPKLSVPIRP